MYYVYIMTNKHHTVFYTGQTHDLKKRVYEHKNELNKKSFTYRYNCFYLVYYEAGGITQYDARVREYQIKDYNRKKKLELINSMNPYWKDLYYEL